MDSGHNLAKQDSRAGEDSKVRAPTSREFTSWTNWYLLHTAGPPSIHPLLLTILFHSPLSVKTQISIRNAESASTLGFVFFITGGGLLVVIRIELQLKPEPPLHTLDQLQHSNFMRVIIPLGRNQQSMLSMCARAYLHSRHACLFCLWASY